MTKAWIPTLTITLVLTGCSSGSEPPGKGSDKAPNTKPHADASAHEEADPPVSDEDTLDDAEPQGEGAPRDAGKKLDAAKEDSKDAAVVDARPSTAPDPRCVRDAGPLGPGVFQPDPNIFGNNDVFATYDGTIFTTAGVIYNVPGAGLIYGRQEADSCVVTVAETGVKTTIFGDGIVCHNSQVVSVGTTCQTDANGDPLP